MDTQEFLKRHTVKSGEFGGDTSMAQTVGHMAAYGFDTMLEVNIKDAYGIARCLTADFLSMYLENRPIFSVDPNGKLHFVRVSPSRKQVQEAMFLEHYAQLIKK